MNNIAFEKGATNLIENAARFLRDLTVIEREVIDARLQWYHGNRAMAIDLLIGSASRCEKDDNSLNCLIGPWLFEEGKIQAAWNRLSTIIQTNPNNWSVWRLWAQVNLNLFQNPAFFIDAIDATLKNLLISVNNPLFFTLQTLSILSRRDIAIVHKPFLAKLKEIPSSVWINVLPQIAAKIRSTEEGFRITVQTLVYTLGCDHPHVVFPQLSVASRSPVAHRRSAGNAVQERFSASCPRLSADFLRLFSQLSRISQTPWERFLEILESATRAWRLRHNESEVIALLGPLNQALDKPGGKKSPVNSLLAVF